MVCHHMRHVWGACRMSQATQNKPNPLCSCLQRSDCRHFIRGADTLPLRPSFLSYVRAHIKSTPVHTHILHQGNVTNMASKQVNGFLASLQLKNRDQSFLLPTLSLTNLLVNRQIHAIWRCFVDLKQVRRILPITLGLHHCSSFAEHVTNLILNLNV